MTPAPLVEPAAPPPAPVAEVDIPELRKKEEEKKRGGLFWRGGSPGPGANLLRAPGGAGGVVHSAPFGLGRIAANLAARLGGSSSAIGRLLLSRAGGWLVFSGMIASGVAFGIFAGLMFRAPAARETAAAPSLNLEGPRSGILVNGPKGKSLDYLQNANEGEISFDDGKASAPKPGDSAEATREGEAAPLAEPVADAAKIGEVDGVAQAEALAAAVGSGNFGKLSDFRGAANGNRFGGSSFGAMGNFKTPLGAKLPAAEGRGKVGAMTKGRKAMSAKDLGRVQGRAARAMGQLKLARFMSSQAKGVRPEEASSQFATNAFDQSKSIGGEMPGSIGGLGAPEVVVPPGTGAPSPDVPVNAPAIPPARDITPYQPQLDAAKGMGNTAGMLRMMGMALIVAGMIIIATAPPWWKLVGVAMVAAGVMMLSMAQNMAKQAKQIADQIKNAQDQTDQAKIAADAAQAKADGKDYTPPDLSDKTKRNEGVKQAVEETRNADYHFDPEPANPSGGARNSPRAPSR